MKINLTHVLGKVEIITEHNDPDIPVSLGLNVEASNDENKKIVQQSLENEINDSSGYYGHTLNMSNLTNLDLSFCVYDLPSFQVDSIVPEIEAKNFPKGALS